jgi:hypothetical protein
VVEAAHVAGLLAAIWLMAGPAQGEGFPFVIPPRGLAEGSAPADLVRAPAPGEAGAFVQVEGARFVLEGSGRPVRFWGTNLCFGGCFPPHDVADRMARRLASLGINCVRFHHMDAAGYPRGIWLNGGWGDFEHTTLHPEALDRLDYLVARLKEQGIYVNLNLHVSRAYGAKDGFPVAGQGEAVPNFGKGVDTFYPRCVEEQRRYARMLLRHVNAYTGNPYAEEPAVAMVEISNEDGLLHQWSSGGLDALPADYTRELQRQWTVWLQRQYGSSAALRTAWAEGEAAGSEEDVLATEGVTGHLEAHGHARAGIETVAESGGRAVRKITVRRPSPTRWHVQHTWGPFSLAAGRSYLLRIRLRANRVAQVGLNCMMNHPPWQTRGLSATLEVGPRWSEHELYFTANRDVAPAEDGTGGARITLTELSQQELVVWCADPELSPAAVRGLLPGEGLEGGVAWPDRQAAARRTPAVRRDLLRFLRDAEVSYWQGMRDYLHGELGVRMPVTGTAVGFTTPHVAAETADFVDSHAYWQHPHFPGRPWDPDNWIVSNRIMANSPAESTVAHLAGRRVFGRPYTVTEYNHPAPHHYEVEGFPLISLYGAQQGWDGIFGFAYSHNDQWETDRFAGFFDMAGHPLKLALQPACSDLLLGRRIAPPRRVARASLSARERLELIPQGLWHFDAYAAGLDRTAWQDALVGFVVGDGAPAPPEGPGAAVEWTLAEGRGLVSYRGAGCTGLIGFAAGTDLPIGQLVMTPGETSLDGFAAVMVSAVDGQQLGEPGRYLVTAASRCWNRGMVWNHERNSVGRNWGEGPTLCEGVPVRLEAPPGAGPASLFALAPDGTRREGVPAFEEDGRLVFELGPRYRTLWYELIVGE